LIHVIHEIYKPIQKAAINVQKYNFLKCELFIFMKSQFFSSQLLTRFSSCKKVFLALNLQILILLREAITVIFSSLV